MKKELRSKLRSILDGMGPTVIANRSRQAAARLFSEPEYQNAEVILIYLSIPHEADTTAIVLDAWKHRKRVLAPRVGWESRRMIPVQIRDLDSDVARGEYGIREPVRGAPYPIELIDLVIVPGLGFDPAGNRLGRGRGFYDRFLSNSGFRGKTCAFALEDQVVDYIPSKDHDVRMDMLVTDGAVRRFAVRERSH